MTQTIVLFVFEHFELPTKVLLIGVGKSIKEVFSCDTQKLSFRIDERPVSEKMSFGPGLAA